MSLNRNLSTLGLLATSLCGMIGSGWLFGALIAAKIAGPAAIVSWIIGGILIAIVALVFAEITTMLPLAGGMIRCIHFSHGAFSSFCTSWLTWLSCVAVAPTEVGATIHYLANFYPSLVTHSSNEPVLSLSGIGVAVIMLGIITLCNVLAVRTLGGIIAKIGTWKVIVPLLTAAVIMSQYFSTANFSLIAGFAPTGIHGILAAVSGVVIFSFLGFIEATALAGETENPQRAVPLAIIGSVLISITVYLVLQIAFIGALPPGALLHTPTYISAVIWAHSLAWRLV